jgi:hypothetical protein
MPVLEIIVAAALFLFGGWLARSALAARRVVQRIRREGTSMVSGLVPGPVKLAGELRSTEPLIALDGTRAVAIQRSLQAQYRNDDDETSTSHTEYTECAEVELHDGSGSCAVEMDFLLIVGAKQQRSLTAQELESSCPKVWQELLQAEPGKKLEQVIAEETIFPEGCHGFVSGEAILDTAPPRGEGYRDGKRRLKVRGHEQRPLILSAWDEATAAKALLRPIRGVAWIALLCWLIGALAVGIALFVQARSGL